VRYKNEEDDKKWRINITTEEPKNKKLPGLYVIVELK
jgi:hypothetical protein